MRYWLVMPAAGAGRRFGPTLPKQYAPLAGRTVIEWALAPFLMDRRCAGAVVALASDDHRFGPIAVRLGLRGTGTDEAAAGRLAAADGAHAAVGAPLVTVVPGGAERSVSVRSALTALTGSAVADDWVLVHDAVRPCLAFEDLQRLIGQVEAHRVGGLLATPASDTLKRAERWGAAGAGAAGAPERVAQTLDRASLWRALTPQMFRYGALCAALDAAHAGGRFPTDEAQALEWAGEHPLLVQGSPANLKITTAADLALAAAVLSARTAALPTEGPAS